MEVDLSIIVNSCDSYSDTWKPFFDLFNIYWSDCPFEKYLLTNSKTIKINNCNIIQCGQNKIWAQRLNYALKKIETDYVLLFLDDHWLKDYVNTDDIIKLLDLAKEEDVGCLRLNFGMENNNKFNNKLNKISKNNPYNVSTYTAIWNVETLIKLTDNNWNPWEFEKKGSIVSENLKREFYKSDTQVISTYNAIIRGKWVETVIEDIQKFDIYIDKSRGYYDNSFKNIYEIKKTIYSFDILNLRKILFLINKKIINRNKQD